MCGASNTSGQSTFSLELGSDRVPQNGLILGDAPINDGSVFWVRVDGGDPARIGSSVSDFVRLPLPPDTPAGAAELYVTTSTTPPAATDEPRLAFFIEAGLDEDAPAAPVVVVGAATPIPASDCGAAHERIALDVETADDAIAWAVRDASTSAVLAIALHRTGEPVALGVAGRRGLVDVVAIDGGGNTSVAVPVDLDAVGGAVGPGGCNAGLDVVGLVALVGLLGFRRRR